MNLEQMTDRAARIVHGTCIDLRRSRHPDLGLRITEITLRIERTAKGRAPKGETVTIRMLEGASPESSGIAGVPVFRPGEEVVLFLHEESPAGLTSPVGLEQGRFRVHRDQKGRAVAVNGFGNRGLLRGLSAAAADRLGVAARRRDDGRGIPLDELLHMVRSLQ